MAAGSAGVSHPVKQGLVQVLSVFLDTCMICTATAMLLLCSGVEPDADMAGMAYVQAAMNSTLGKFGVVFITVSLFLFAFYDSAWKLLLCGDRACVSLRHDSI